MTVDAILQATADDRRSATWLGDVSGRKITQHPLSIQVRSIGEFSDGTSPVLSAAIQLEFGPSGGRVQVPFNVRVMSPYTPVRIELDVPDVSRSVTVNSRGPSRRSAR